MPKTTAHTPTTAVKPGKGAPKGILKTGDKGGSKGGESTTKANTKANALLQNFDDFDPAPQISSITGTVSSAGVLLWADKQNDTWWLTDKDLQELLPNFGLKYGPINSKTSVVLMGDTRRIDGWNDSNKASDLKTQMDNKKRDDKLIACSWTECLYENPDFKQAVRNLCSHVRFDPKDQKKYVAKGAKFRTASVLRMKLAQKQRDDKKKKAKEDEDSDESDSDE